MTIANPLRATGVLGGALLLASCVAAPTPPPEPAPVAAPAPPPSGPAMKDWRDLPAAAGDWSYRTAGGATLASFGPAGQPPLLVFRCDTASRRIMVERATSLTPMQIGGQMSVHTSFGDAQWPVAAGSPAADGTAHAVAARAGNDVVFDKIAYSRGRFVIETPGTAPLSLPNWPEISRVIEDCRG